MGRGDPAEWLWRHPVWIRLSLDVRHEWWCCLLALTKDRCGEDLSCCADTGHRRQRLAEGERGSAGWLSPAPKTCYRTGALFPAAPAHLLHPGKQVDLASVFGKRVWWPSRVWQPENGEPRGAARRSRNFCLSRQKHTIVLRYSANSTSISHANSLSYTRLGLT
jgi:hypothetical protein